MSLWVSTPRVIAVASIGMHRDTFSPPGQLVSIALHICTIFTRAEVRPTHLRWAFTAGKHKLLSSHAQPGPVVARAPGPVDKSIARHLLGLCEFGSDRPGLTTIRILAGVNCELTIPTSQRRIVGGDRVAC